MRLSVAVLFFSSFLFLGACKPTDGGGGSEPANGNQGIHGDSGQRDPERNLSASLQQDQTVAIDLAQKPLPDGASLKIDTYPAHGTVSLNGNRATYTPAAGFVGSDSFTYRLTQQNGQSDSYTVTLTISQARRKPAPITNVRVATWKGDAQAAYSIIHDDFCAGNFDTDGQIKHWHELSDRGLVAGFGAITSFCDTRYWEEMQKMTAAGMEIINHTHTHPSPVSTPPHPDGLLSPGVNLDQELGTSNQTLHSHGIDASYFVFPLDKSNDDILGRVADMGYLGARGGEGRKINAADLKVVNDELAPFRANFDCYNIHQAGEANCSKHDGPTPLAILDLYLDDAINNHGWALRELHGIGENDSWGWVSVQDYRAHLHYVKSKVDSGAVWMATPSNVTRYWAARAYCGTPSHSTGQLEFDNPLSPCINKYATPLDVVVTMPGASNVMAIQNDQRLNVRSLDNDQFLISGVNPVGGKVSVTVPES